MMYSLWPSKENSTVLAHEQWKRKQQQPYKTNHFGYLLGRDETPENENVDLRGKVWHNLASTACVSVCTYVQLRTHETSTIFMVPCGCFPTVNGSQNIWLLDDTL